MTSGPATCDPATSLRLVAQLMSDHDCAAIPITESGRLVGIITDRDRSQHLHPNEIRVSPHRCDRAPGALMMPKLELQSWEQMVADEMAAAEIVEVEFEEPLVDDFGITYEAWEELAFGGAKEIERDVHRWELDPASAEDYPERNRGGKSGPALKWRHFGH